MVRKCIKRLMRFLKDEERVTAIEYGLVAALISVAIIAALTGAGESLNAIFNRMKDDLDTASTAS
jgi:pilus assembly protein Flp/PilA